MLENRKIGNDAAPKKNNLAKSHLRPVEAIR
jgi:hypothetical protein